MTEEKISKKYLNLIETLCGEWKGKIIDYDGEEELKLYSSSNNNNIPSTSQSTTNKNLNNLFNSTAPYARFLSFLLIVLIGSLILAILACFWSHWRRQYLRKKCEIKLENEQKQIKRSQQLLCEPEKEGEREEENLNLNEINNKGLENERRRIIVQEIAV
uniref:Candidate secreted effector n=1 Tax=Meloidogyne incognita TaxID=6306 RepID=A0A914ND97_MELIC